MEGVYLAMMLIFSERNLSVRNFKNTRTPLASVMS